jgi:hypothetical protein
VDVSTVTNLRIAITVVFKGLSWGVKNVPNVAIHFAVQHAGAWQITEGDSWVADQLEWEPRPWFDGTCF